MMIVIVMMMTMMMMMMMMMMTMTMMMMMMTMTMTMTMPTLNMRKIIISCIIAVDPRSTQIGDATLHHEAY